MEQSFAAADNLSGSLPFLVAAPRMEDLPILHPPEAKARMILRTRAADDILRSGPCRATVWHIAPNWTMKPDGPAHYLVWEGWNRWFQVHGRTPDDIAFAGTLAPAAAHFGATMVETRDCAFEAGVRRVESGHRRVRARMPMLTRGGPNMTTSWHRSFRRCRSMSCHSAFERLAERRMNEADDLGRLGGKTFPEAGLQRGVAGPEFIQARPVSPDFVVPGFEGIGRGSHSWDRRLR